MQLDVNSALSAPTSATLAYPKIVGCYSLDTDRNYQANFSQLKYLVLPRHGDNVNFNLNRRFRHFLDKPPGIARQEKIDHLLEFIAKNFRKLRQPQQQRILRYDFVCFRGLLTKIMITPFERENWTINATCLNGTIYMWSWQEERNFPHKEKFIHWGYKFENYMFSKLPNQTPDPDEPANANEEFCVMFSTRVNNTLVLYGAEVDGVDSSVAIGEENEILNGVKLVEVKTSRIVTSQKGEKTLLQKTLKWFCQSFLVGIEDIYVGFRDDKGFVKTVEKSAVNEMPNKAAGLWNKKDCLKFLDAFLKFVQNVVGNKSEPYVTWLFDYDCKNGIVTVSKMENNPDYLFLPRWYIDMINKEHNI